MAHAGTPRDLATLPTVSGPGGRSGLWQALLVVIVTAAIEMATMFIVASKAPTGGPATDRSYDQIENLRGRANFSVSTEDRSYDAIESMRGAVPLVDTRSEDIAAWRGTINAASPVTNLTVDHRYDDVQNNLR